MRAVRAGQVAARRACEVRRDEGLSVNGHRDGEHAVRVDALGAAHVVGELESERAFAFFNRQVADRGVCERRAAHRRRAQEGE